MNRIQLEMFLSLSKNLNFTKTANEFFTSQPTISRQIVLLEEEWGFPLFIRNKREVTLTSAGIIMAEKCHEALNIIDEGLKNSKKTRNGTTGSIRIGMLETLNSSVFVMPVASYFNRLFPDIHLNIEKRSFGELREKLDNGHLDIIFTLDFDLRHMKGIAYDKYCDLTAGILMSSQHKLAKKEFLMDDDLKDEVFLLPCPEDTPGRKEDLERILKSAGLIYKDIVYRDNADSVNLNIRTGKGVALLDNSISVIADEAHYKFFPVKKEHAPLALVYAWKQDNQNAALVQLINILLQKETIDIFQY